MSYTEEDIAFLIKIGQISETEQVKPKITKAAPAPTSEKTEE
jgi:hypothetical protein